jgi:hypothetical protein
MSPDLFFLASLALKMAVTAAFVVTASVITERAGPVIGALVSTLPISAGPAYVFLALGHDREFIADSALASVSINAATTVYALVYVLLAQKRGLLVSLGAALGLWFALAALIAVAPPSFPVAFALNAAALALCIAIVRRYRAVKMPLITRRWYDVPVRAAAVACLVAFVVTLSNHVGGILSGVIATFPIVLSSLIVILHPRIGGPATAAVIANTLWGLIGFGLAVAAIHVAVVPLGAPLALTLALAVAVGWNFMLWQLQRRRRLRV